MNMDYYLLRMSRASGTERDGIGDGLECRHDNKR